MIDRSKAKTRLGLETDLDFLYHFPVRYLDSKDVRSIESLKKGDEVVVFGQISGLKTKKGFKSRIPMCEATLSDASGKIKIVWFYQPYLAKMINEGAFVRVEGKVSQRKPKNVQHSMLNKGELYFSNPKIEAGPTLLEQNTEHSLFPVYPETRGITSNWIFHQIQKIFSSGILDELKDPIPDNILKLYRLPTLRTALIWIHTPQKLADAESAKKRFAFEEIFFIQLDKQKTKHEFAEKNAFIITKSEAEMQKFIERFPFEATAAQHKTINHILSDFKSGHPMSRLLEGDVGSGKTAVAAAAAYAVTTSRPKGQTFGSLQTAYMCPTEILAQQHFESFIKYFKHLPLNIALITGTGCRKFPSKVNPNGWTDISRAQLLKWVASGEISILIGTHALIQKSVKFKHLALAIIDEQHRFGTAQRQKLVDKDTIVPHLLSMTATPIPRTLALTLYGDLDLSLLDEMPAGRKQIITEIVAPERRKETYEEIRREMKVGRQLYVICPRIDAPLNDADPTQKNAESASSPHEIKSVKEEAKRLETEIFPEYSVGILHSKMNPKEKEQVMFDFKNKEIDILVATSVVEVGVNVENASLIIIEGAERFGLAQLHQLRGRVLRGTHQPYCFVFAETKSAKTMERLKALKTARNGFELAEFDLSARGAGELYSGKQWGLSDLAMQAIKNIKMVEAARTEATKIIESDPKLINHPNLKARVESASKKIHFE